MRSAFAAVLLATTAIACSPSAETANNSEAAAAASDLPQPPADPTLARVEMKPDVSFLTDEERQVVNLLNQAANLMTQIYARQAIPDYKPGQPLDPDAPGLPEGAGFYPADVTREQMDAYLAAHPGEREALMSPYTVVRREGAKLVAVPYSQAYREWLVPAAKLLEQAVPDHHQSQPQAFPQPAGEGVPQRRLFRIRTRLDGPERHADRGRDRPVRGLY